MAADLNSQQLARQLSKVFHRYNFIMFVLLAGIILATVLFTLTGIIQSVYDMSSRQSTASPTFDTATIQALEQLQPSTTDGAPLQLPAGRTNPMSE